MSKPLRIIVALEPTSESYLVCIACGGFHCDYAVKNGNDGPGPQAGLHKRCVDTVRVKRGATS